MPDFELGREEAANVHAEAHTGISPRALDHVALWVADRDAMAEFLSGALGTHEIQRTEEFTLMGADARRGKLTLFAAEGPREPGVLERIVLRVSDLGRALGALPGGVEVERPLPELATFEGPEGLRLGLTPVLGGVDYDIDHVVLRVPDREEAAAGLAELGFAPRGGALHVADKSVVLEEGSAAADGRPLLNHIALLVDSAEALEDQARRRGHEVEDVVDAPNTLAVFLRGPAGIRLEYVEHKPTFSLY